MSETGITVGKYDKIIGENLYTIRFRDAETVGKWLSTLIIAQSILEDKNLVLDDKKTLLKTITPKHPVEFTIEYAPQAAFEMDNGTNLVQASIFMPIKNEILTFPKKIRVSAGSYLLKPTNSDNVKRYYKFVTGKTPKMLVSASEALNINFATSEEVRAVLVHTLINTTCPHYVYDKAIFKCDNTEIARMPIYSKDITNSMGFIPYYPFDTKDIQFKSSSHFPRLGNLEPPKFNEKNLRLFIYDTYRLLKGQPPETTIKEYVQLAFKAYNGEAVVDWNWNGEWTRASQFDVGVLEISNSNSSTFDFTLEVYSGAHVRNMEGTARINGKRASFTDEYSACELTFTHKGELIFIKETIDCSLFSSTTYAGEFALEPPALMENSLYPSIIEDKTVNDELQELFGEDYPLFYDTMQLVYTGEYDDEVKGNVISGAVRGLFTIMEAIIVIGDDGSLYGAVINNGSIHYYTNNPNYKNKLPISIVTWMQYFNYYDVKYLSK